MAQPLLPSDHDPIATHDHIVRLHDVPWADYERLLEIRGDQSAPRYTYLEGELEIMSPSKTHEAVKSVIGRLVEVWCLENGVEFSTLGSWTVKDREVQRGAEPDECYVFGKATDSVAPDLAIEVVWTSGGINKLEVYRKLGVNEVWYWSRGLIDVYLLRDEQYGLAPASQVLPGINLRQLEGFVNEPTTSAAILAYRAALRG